LKGRNQTEKLPSLGGRNRVKSNPDWRQYPFAEKEFSTTSPHPRKSSTTIADHEPRYFVFAVPAAINSFR
jgi:hypothetical protein